MQTIQAELEATHGVQILGVCADAPDTLATKLGKKGFTFPLLGDPELKAISAYGLRHEGGNPLGGDIARPALVLIDEAGKIRFRWLTDNWRVRPVASDILEAVKKEFP